MQVDIGNEVDTGSYVPTVDFCLDLRRLFMESSDGTKSSVHNLHRDSMVYNLEKPKGPGCTGNLFHDRRPGTREVDGWDGEGPGFGFGFEVG